MKPLTTVAFVLCVASSATAAVIKVPQDQATLTLAVGAAAAGDTILVKAGVYEENVVIGAPLTGLKIKGLGVVIVDARPGGATGSGPGFDILADNVTIENVLIRHAKGTGPNGVRAVANGTVLNKVRVEHADGAGVQITGNDAFLSKCEVVDCDGGISISGNDAEITNGSVHRDASGGISILGNDGTVTKCFVHAIDGPGIFVVGDGAKVQTTTVRRATVGMDVQGNGATLMKNIVDAIVGEGVMLSAATSGTIEKNTITDTLGSCLVVTSTASNVILNKNDIRRCGSSLVPAAWIDGDNNSVTNTLVRQSAGDGVLISGDNNSLFKVTSSEHGEDGIQFTGIGNSADKCIARKNQGEGMQCDAATNSLTKAIVQLNRIDVAASVPFATFNLNVFTTGGNATTPEIDD